MTTGLIFSDVYLEHDTGPHPENSLRLSNTVSHFRQTGLWDRFEHLLPRAATVEEIERAHGADQIAFAREVAESGGGHLDGDTPVSPRSYESAMLAAGGLFTALDSVMEGEVDNGICLVRPPGHHATPQRSMGFCLFNNIALGAMHLRETHGLERILIADFDVHHGNGTQDIFYDDPSVLFFSLHRYPFYPGTGSASERGDGPGEGFTVNVPLPGGTSTEEYMAHFTEFVEGQAVEYDPDFILISAGFDGYVLDPLGAFCLHGEQFKDMTLRLRDLASKVCSGRVVSTLEGGYNLNDLPKLIAAHAEGLLG